jgi:hypothetical protein
MEKLGFWVLNSLEKNVMPRHDVILSERDHEHPGRITKTMIGY